MEKQNWLQRITKSNSNIEAMMVLIDGVFLVGLLGAVITAIYLPIF